MDHFPLDYGGMEYSYSNQSLYSSPGVSTPDSFTASPYDELSAMMSFDFRGYFQPDQTLDSPTSFGLGSRPIEIPMPSSSSGFHTPFTPSPYSSSPSVQSPYDSPATSQSSFSTGGGSSGGGRNAMNTSGMMPFGIQQMPVMLHASSPDYFLQHPAAIPPATSTPLGSGQPRRATQRIQTEKPSRSFDCKKCGKLFTRLADVKRHETSVHDPIPIDCPIENCVRKGSIGFPRRDHLIEHLRTFHNKDIPKRSVNKKRKSNPML